MADVQKASGGYWGVGISAVVLGWVGGVLLVSQKARFEPAPEIGLFALVYVLAQVVERIVEFSLPYVERIIDSSNPASQRKADALGSGSAGDLESAEADKRALAFGIALGLAYVGCGYFEIGLLEMIGVEELEPWVDRLVSGVVIAGGSKPLHDLISKVQKSKQKDEKTTA